MHHPARCKPTRRHTTLPLHHCRQAERTHRHGQGRAGAKRGGTAVWLCQLQHPTPCQPAQKNSFCWRSCPRLQNTESFVCGSSNSLAAERELLIPGQGAQGHTGTVTAWSLKHCTSLSWARNDPPTCWESLFRAPFPAPLPRHYPQSKDVFITPSYKDYSTSCDYWKHEQSTPSITEFSTGVVEHPDPRQEKNNTTGDGEAQHPACDTVCTAGASAQKDAGSGQSPCALKPALQKVPSRCCERARQAQHCTAHTGSAAGSAGNAQDPPDTALCLGPCSPPPGTAQPTPCPDGRGGLLPALPHNLPWVVAAVPELQNFLPAAQKNR